jgi:hypothetical protein
MYICLSASNNWTLTGRILMKFGILGYFENMSKKIRVKLKSDKIRGTLLEDLCMFVIIPQYSVLRMGKVSDKVVEKIKTHLLFYFDPYEYTVRFFSVYTISQQLHNSDSLLITFSSPYMFRHMYVIIREPSVVCPAELH